MNDMKQFLLKLNKKYPGAIDLFINHLKQQKQAKNRLFIVSILCAFNEHIMDTSWKQTFSDVYKKFKDTGFIIKYLNEDDKEYITTRYIEEVEKIGKEVIKDAI